MSRETRRNDASEESDTKTSEMSKGRLAYPESRAPAALQTWQREMLLHLGGKELSHVAEDYGELSDMPDKRIVKQGVLASLLLEPRGCLRNLPNLREHLLQTQSGEHEKRELKRHGGRLFKVMCDGIESLPIPKEHETLMQWRLSRMRTLKLSPSASIKDVRSYLKDLDEAIKNADAKMSLRDYLQILDRAVEPGDGEYQRDGWHRFWGRYAGEVKAMGRELTTLEVKTAFETWWQGQDSDTNIRAQMPTYSARDETDSARRTWPRRKAAAAVAEDVEEGEPDESELEAPRLSLRCDVCDVQCDATVGMEDGEVKVAYAVSYCDGCGHNHQPGCWGKCDVERNPEAEERLRARDPDRLAMLDQMRDQDCKARGLKKQAPPFGQLPRSAASRAVPVQPRARIPPAPPRHPSARAATVPTRTTPAARRKVALAAMADEKTAMEATWRLGCVRWRARCRRSKRTTSETRTRRTLAPLRGASLCAPS